MHKGTPPEMNSALLRRYASFFLSLEYASEFRNGKENGNADCVSQVFSFNKTTTTDRLINEEKISYSIPNQSFEFQVVLSLTTS